MDIKIRRAYDCVTSSDGYRVLVDRIWPRGLSKKELRIDCWMKDLAPSTPLRKWYGHDPKKWKQFKKRYFGELADHPDLIDELIALGQKSVITLVFAAKDQEHSNAAALRDYLIQNPA
ncbi:DUF488 domain-containing protein [Hyphococcus luteus]|uniref:DUF488 domain-containing protein n=1 Tax=Hyphococcus luteus TaxID=2058213 RepID=A0A2S7KBI6_9PROT|nr:DUF488 family protein [Marinicaulis flavus]PQA89789.1 hypothetical protein CW354_02260 [Marinicaulis flavus]